VAMLVAVVMGQVYHDANVAFARCRKNRLDT
jgi:hypothetical protein